MTYVKHYNRSIEIKGILKQSESEEALNRQEATNSIQVISAIMQGQVVYIYVNYLYCLFLKSYLN